jgi:NADH:ubiquinone reductase (H+-translocating)
MAEEQRHRVVIIGAGFGGMFAAQNLKRSPVDITIIDRRNFHLFQPLLYQVATGGLSPANIACPIRAVFKYQNNARVLLGQVTRIDTVKKEVQLGDDETVPFDTLIVAAGAVNSFFKNPEWEKFSPGLKTIEEATEIRRRILSAFEAAERVSDPVLRKRLLTFVIVGGGATGVEMAGAISDLAAGTLKRNFRNFDPAMARIVIVEGSHVVLSNFPEKLSLRAGESLTKMGVEMILQTYVKEITDDYVMIQPKAGGPMTKIETSTVIWAAGVRANPLANTVAEATGAKLDRGSRVLVNKDMTVPGHPNIFVIGDMSSSTDKDGNPFPGVAPVAMQQGKYVAKVITNRITGDSPPGDFKYWDKGSMATIGSGRAVVDLYWLRFSGFFAWMTWLFVHLMFLVQFQNKLLVLLQWGWNYVSRNRSARLITGEHALWSRLPEIDDDVLYGKAKALAAAAESPVDPATRNTAPGNGSADTAKKSPEPTRPDRHE